MSDRAAERVDVVRDWLRAASLTHRVLCVDACGCIVAPDDPSRIGLRVLYGDDGRELPYSADAVECAHTLALLHEAHARDFIGADTFERRRVAIVIRLVTLLF